MAARTPSPRGSGGLVSLEMSGIDAVQAILAAAAGKANLLFARALYEEANLIMNDSLDLVPIRRGILRASADVSLPRITPTSVSITFGYGGAAAEYAVIQHENTSFRHAPGRTAKFLEAPTLARAGDFSDRVTRRLRSIMSGR